jgi:hypothetical protein
VVWTDSWPSIACAGCVLICVGAVEERERKVYALWGLWGAERQVGSARGTRWPAGSRAGCMVARKARRSHGQELVQGSGSRLESACRVCGGSPQNWPGYLVEPQNQDRRLLTVKIRQPSHEFTFGVGISLIPYPLVLMRTMCGSRTSGWSLPCVMRD